MSQTGWRHHNARKRGVPLAIVIFAKSIPLIFSDYSALAKCPDKDRFFIIFILFLHPTPPFLRYLFT
jgi:hypothetical protein